ncbi:hypothetical protein LAM01_10820 [Amylolactobacillus amylophilus]|nr:hypothetical protein LAM01_10820 [Amylolactobacillus amylophilus]
MDMTPYLMDFHLVERAAVAIIVKKDKELDFTFMDGSKVRLTVGVWTPNMENGVMGIAR